MLLWICHPFIICHVCTWFLLFLLSKKCHNSGIKCDKHTECGLYFPCYGFRPIGQDTHSLQLSS
ncbi:hypothetical protein BDQ94DRAFT_148474, partial [Aspergillus welwitschiae]